MTDATSRRLPPIFIYPCEQIEVHGPDDADVIGTLEMNYRGHLGFFRADGIMYDLSGTLPLDTIFAGILRRRAEQDKKHGGSEHDDTHTPGEWCEFIQRFRNRAEFMTSRGRNEEYEDALLDIAALACAALESNQRKRKDRNA